MPLPGLSALQEAAQAGRAIPGFVAYNLETAQGIIAAAERSGLPVLLQAGSSAFRHAGFLPLATIALQLARNSDAAVGVHLDHSRSLEEITSCLRLGYSSVMIDGSHLPYEENIAITAATVHRAHDMGAWVEAELTSISGHEDLSTDATAGPMTDPAQAAEFVIATGVDALAVAIGNVHGFTHTRPHIDLDRLAALQATTGVPLVLHGASGLTDKVLLECVALGIAKVNFNAEVRRAFLLALQCALPAANPTSDLAGALNAGREAVAGTAERIVRLLSDVASARATTGPE